MSCSVRERLVWMSERRATLAFLFLLFLFFLCMDIALYHKILQLPPTRPPSNGTTAMIRTETTFSPFSDLSVKVMMMDPVNHYVHNYLATIFNKVTKFSSTFYFVSPNFLSLCGFLFALAASKCIMSDNFSFHLLAIILLQVRCWFDALDGIVARARLGIVKNVSLKFTLGYIVDGIADTAGYTVFLICCFVYLKRSILKNRSPIRDYSEKDQIRYSVIWTPKSIFRVCFMFGAQLMIAGGLWNRYVETYDKVLDTQLENYKLAIAQNEMLKSSITLLVIWIWRICNAHGLMQIYMVAVLLHKQWDFLQFIQHIGFVILLIAFIISELHLNQMRSNLAIL